jgi:hypothetical protein
VKKDEAEGLDTISLEPNMIEGTILGVRKEDFDEALTYPKCLTQQKFFRFMLAPTCCFQLTYPLSPTRNYVRMIEYFLEFCVA